MLWIVSTRHLGTGALLKVPYSHISGLLAALASAVVSFQAEVEVPNAVSISSCWGYYLRVVVERPKPVALVRGGGPGSCVVIPSVCLLARVDGSPESGGGPPLPPSAARILKPSQFSDKSGGSAPLGVIEPSPTTFYTRPGF